jgi:hypothetical protein
VVSSETHELALEFDKPVNQIAMDGDINARSPRVDGSRVTVDLAPRLTPGKRYAWSAEVKDAGGNQTSVAGRFYGPNDHPALLRLNEVRVAGAGEHTDFVELKVERAGSLGGWTLDAYTAADARQRLVLPDKAVAKGELIVIRYREGPSDTKGALEFRLPDGKGLSATKGLLVLRPEPAGSPTDGLLYSKTPGDGAPLGRSGGWTDSSELNPEACTSTRTWNRTEDGSWFLSANGGATPGQPNTTTVWTSTPKKKPKSSAKANPRGSRRVPRRGRDPSAKPEPRAAGLALQASKPAKTQVRIGTARNFPEPEEPAPRPSKSSP